MQVAATQTNATEKKYVLDTYVMGLEGEAEKIVESQLSELEQLRLAKTNEDNTIDDSSEPAHEISPEKLSLRKRMKRHFSLAAPKAIEIPNYSPTSSSNVDTDSVKSTSTPSSSVLSETDLTIPTDLPHLDILDENNNIQTLAASPTTTTTTNDKSPAFFKLLTVAKEQLQSTFARYWEEKEQKDDENEKNPSVSVQSRITATLAERRNSTRRRLLLNIDSDEEDSSTTIFYTVGVLLTVAAVVIGFVAPSYVTSITMEDKGNYHYNPNTSIAMVFPTDGNQFNQVNQLQWKVDGLFDSNHTRFAQVADVEVYLNDVMVYSDILNLGVLPETVMTLNIDQIQPIGEYNARVLMHIPLPGGRTKELEAEVDYEIVLSKSLSMLDITSPTNGTLFMKDDAVEVFFKNGEEDDDTVGIHKVMLLEINDVEYFVETTTDVLTLNGMEAGKYDVRVSLLSGNQTTVMAADKVEFEILERTADGYSRLSTPELRNRLGQYKYSANDHTTYGLIESILNARSENAIEQH